MLGQDRQCHQKIKQTISKRHLLNSADPRNSEPLNIKSGKGRNDLGMKGSRVAAKTARQQTEQQN